MKNRKGKAFLAITILVIVGLAACFRMARGFPVSQAMQASPQWRDGTFHNPQPLWNDPRGMFTGAFASNPYGRPKAGEIPVVHPDARELMASTRPGLQFTWLGHSTVFLDVDGVKVLTDPVWGERASPVSWLGPERWYSPPLALDALPRPDVVVISHDHYDHLDRPTIEAMRTWNTRFVVPLGVGAYLRAWGIQPSRITELDWWRSCIVGSLEIIATPARHASGRGLFDHDRTLWAGYALRTENHRVYFSGDTGLFEGLRDIGDKLGPFDLTLIEIGAYSKAWPDWHLGPEQAVLAQQMVKGKRMLPIHWGLFSLAGHGWTEPVERLRSAAERQGVETITPRPGEPWTLLSPRKSSPWWPSIPWRKANEDPIRATKNGTRPIPSD